MLKYVVVLLGLAAPLWADAPEIEGARAVRSGTGWRIDVTLLHPDSGWDHYADGWRVELLSGEVMGLRELVHPHVTEQPFTRSLSGVDLPEGVTTVNIRARCLVDGWSDDVFPLTLD